MIVLVFGTRPEAIKLGPVAAELRALGTPFRCVATGQHRDLLRGTPAETDLAAAESLALASDGNVLRWLSRAERKLRTLWSGPREIDNPLIVVVQGDTMSALVGARVAKAFGYTLAHVEAGVRSHNTNEPWPEEVSRVEIDAAADFLYAPTTTAWANLVAEGISSQRIRLTGNTGVSAMHRYALAEPAEPSDHLLITMHRREWLSGPAFTHTLDAFSEAAKDHAAARFVWPMHPAVRAQCARWLAALPPNLIVIPPLPYREAVGLLAHAFGCITDSGGVAEEAATLGVPAIHLRNVTDRPEAVEAGVALCEPPTPLGVHNAMQALTTGVLPRRPTDVFGDASAAHQVASHLASLTLD